MSHGTVLFRILSLVAWVPLLAGDGWIRLASNLYYSPELASDREVSKRYRY
jgi:hypothetical protein